MPSRQRSQRVEAVVLRHSDWGEADRLLWLFTRQLGKIRVVAKGVRKMRSRKAGHLEPFTHVALQLSQTRDLALITQAETIDPYLHLRDDLERVGYASYVVELLDRFTYEEGENAAIYRLLTATLERINSLPDVTVPIHYYEIRLLDLLGFRPLLFQCARCDAEIRAEDQYFSAPSGGVLCPNCGQSDTGLRPISIDALRYLRHFQRSTYADASRAQLSSELNAEIDLIMQYYLTYLLERGLNSPEFLRRLRRDMPAKVSSQKAGEDGVL